MKEEHAMGPEDLLEMKENTKSVNGTKSKEKKVSRISVISKATEKDGTRLGESAVANHTKPQALENKALLKIHGPHWVARIPLHTDVLSPGPGSHHLKHCPLHGRENRRVAD